MRLILLGPPGSGKGTQAEYITEHFEIPKISTGDMLRHSMKGQSALDLQIKALMDVGSLVSDDIMIKLVKERICHPDCEKGCLLDGFPRTLKQAEALVAADILIDKVIILEVPDEIIVQRLSGRRIHPRSGRVYHIENKPPNRPDKDDITGEPLIQREDDEEGTIRRRLKIYHTQTEPIFTYYLRLNAHLSRHAPTCIRIDGNQPPLVVCDMIFRELNR